MTKAINLEDLCRRLRATEAAMCFPQLICQEAADALEDLATKHAGQRQAIADLTARVRSLEMDLISRNEVRDLARHLETRSDLPMEAVTRLRAVLADYRPTGAPRV